MPRTTLVLLLVVVPVSAPADEPWVITTPVVVTEPAELGEIIVWEGGSLTVVGVPEPGLRLSGHIWVAENGLLQLIDSVIEFKSIYHGQYSLVAADRASVVVDGCTYRVTPGTQHALIAAGDAELRISDSDLTEIQLLTMDRGRLTAERLNGNFEVLLQHGSEMSLRDIPRDPEGGKIWVWVEIQRGSRVVYSPPMPGFVEHWQFPPADAVGITQRVEVERCDTLLWPLLVREDSELTLRDIPSDSWVVVGLHLPSDATISGLYNALDEQTTELALADRVLRLENASIDTWNLYPQAEATVVVAGCLLGEILAMESSTVIMTNTTIDGTGGFFGSREQSRIEATDCTFTCTIEASQESVMTLRHSLVLLNEYDPSGAYTRFGAYDEALLLADHTVVETTPSLGGDGVIAYTWIEQVPAGPPGPGQSLLLSGSAALYSLGEPLLSGWRLQAVPFADRPAVLIAGGDGNVEEAELGVWQDADPSLDYQLRIELDDSRGRRLRGGKTVYGTATGPRRSGGRAGS